MTIPFSLSSPSDDRIFESLYSALRARARSLLKREQCAYSMSATMLVHETWLSLARSRDLRIADSTHFIRLASRLMKNLLIDRARKRRASTNGGGLHRTEWNEAKAATEEDSDTILAVAEALQALATYSPRLAELVELRYFAGFTEEEVAQTMGTTGRTVRRQWRVARNRLRNSMISRREGSRSI